MKIGIVLAREVDGRWMGEAPDYPGVLVYGRTREEARDKAEALARAVIEDRT